MSRITSTAVSGGGSTTFLNVPKPAQTTAGDLLVVGVMVGPSNPTVYPAEGWQLVDSIRTGYSSVYVYTRLATASEPAHWTWTVAFATPLSGAVVLYRNEKAAITPTNRGSSSTGGGTYSYTVNGLSPSDSTDVELWFAASGSASGANNPTLSVPLATGQQAPTLLHNTGSGSINLAGAVWDRPVNVLTGTQQSTLTQTSSGGSGSGGAVRLLLTRNQQPNPPTLIYPAGGQTIARTDEQTFEYEHRDPNLDGQAAQQFRHRAAGTTTWTELPQAQTTVQRFVFAAGTFPLGDREWQVRTSDGKVWSEWSATGFVTFADRPAGPTFLTPTNGQTISSSTYSVQVSGLDYDTMQLQVVDSVGNELLPVLSSTSGQFTVSGIANSQTITQRARQVKAGLAGAWTTISNPVSFTPPTKPGGRIDLDRRAVRITATNPAGSPTVTHNLVWRRRHNESGDGTLLRDLSSPTPKPLHLPANGAHTDWTVANGRKYAYRLQAVAVNGTTSLGPWLTELGVVVAPGDVTGLAQVTTARGTSWAVQVASTRTALSRSTTWAVRTQADTALWRSDFTVADPLASLEYEVQDSIGNLTFGTLGGRDAVARVQMLTGQRNGVKWRSRFHAASGAPAGQNLGVAPQDEVWFGYSAYLPSAFDETVDAKLPGIAGLPDDATGWHTSAGGVDQTDAWSARVHTRAPGGYGITYPYFDAYLYAQQANGESIASKPYGIWVRASDGLNGAGTAYEVPFDRWFTVEMRVKMNSAVNVADGEYELWIDGRKGVSLTGVQWVSTGPTPKVNQIMAETFYSGTGPSTPNHQVGLIDMVLAPYRPTGGGTGDPVQVPTGLTATSSDSRTYLDWTDVPDASSYRVWARNEDALTPTQVDEVTVSARTSGVLTAGQLIHYSVSAVVGGVESARTAEVPVVVEASTPTTRVKPDATNTGIAGKGLTAANLTTFTGDNRLTTAGAVYERVYFPDRVYIGADNITFRECLIESPNGLYTIHWNAKADGTTPRGTLFEDCTIDGKAVPGVNDGTANGGGPSALNEPGLGFTMRRCNLSRAADILKPQGSSSTRPILVESSFLHTPVKWYFVNSSGVLEGTHSDVLQIAGGTANCTIRGCSLDGYRPNEGGEVRYASSSGCQYGSFQGTSKLDGVNIEECWIDGGGYAFTLDKLTTLASITNSTIRNNRIGLKHRFGVFNSAGTLAADGSTIAIYGNVWDETGTTDSGASVTAGTEMSGQVAAPSTGKSLTTEFGSTMTTEAGSTLTTEAP